LILTDNNMANLPVDQAALDLQEVHDVLGMCGMSDQATRTRFITNEGFTSLGQFSILVDDSDVTSMAARISRRTQEEGKITLGTTVIKRLRLQNKRERSWEIYPEDFDASEDASLTTLCD
jgi:hypothetical protein